MEIRNRHGNLCGSPRPSLKDRVQPIIHLWIVFCPAKLNRTVNRGMAPKMRKEYRRSNQGSNWKNMDMLPAPCGTSYQQALDLSRADLS
jgi:hypothetical protein